MRERLTRLFFFYFFRALLVVIAIGEWVCVGWLLRAAGADLPRWLDFVMPAVFYVANLFLVRIPPGLPWAVRRTIEVYTAFAFTSVFAFAFLLLNTIAWTALGVLTEGVSWATGPQTAGLVDLSARGYDFSTTCGIAGIGLLFTWGYTFGQQAVVVTHHRLRFRRAGKGLHGVRIAQISDIHIGRYMNADLLERFVAQVNDIGAEIIVVTGDLLDHTRDISWGFPILGKLRAKHGVFVILGNHDVYAGADEVEAGLKRHTTHRVLRDEVASLCIDGAPLHVIGLNDLGRDWARGVLAHPALTTPLASLPADDPVLLLSHRPDLFPQAVDHGIELTLSGHTHGGQLSLPKVRGRRWTLARFMTPYDRGLYTEGDSSLYVNLGLGCTGQRVRIFAPREISVFEIESA